MMRKVRNKARPIKTWFGGVCRVPSAFLKKEKTTTMRVKEVKRTKMDGASAKTVKMRRISKVATRSSGRSAGLMLMDMDGGGVT